MADRGLLDGLVKRATGYRDRAPVFRVVQPVVMESVREARTLAASIWSEVMECELRPTVGGAMARLRLPDDGRIDVFQASGAISALFRPPRARQPLAADERTADRKALVSRLEKIASVIAKLHVAVDDELRFESLWETKAQGVTLTGEKTPIALLEAVGAFRRYLRGLPVLGRASVHVTIGGGSHVTQWGIDWRRVRAEAFAETQVVTPDEGAERVQEELWWRRPERQFTLEDFEPKSLTLGFLSFARRCEQFVMQPAWVAVLAPRARTTMGHVVAVPAAPRAFEPICRPARAQPPCATQRTP
jgi:hypothetical protein